MRFEAAFEGVLDLAAVEILVEERLSGVDACGTFEGSGDGVGSDAGFCFGFTGMLPLVL
jgi:hypothetical protein